MLTIDSKGQTHGIHGPMNTSDTTTVEQPRLNDSTRLDLAQVDVLDRAPEVEADYTQTKEALDLAVRFLRRAEKRLPNDAPTALRMLIANAELCASNAITTIE